MKIFKEIKLLQRELSTLKNRKLKIGFVPTMGALHKGHISIIDRCSKECDVTVVSIYVNPLQFNNSNDYTNYPIRLEEDQKLLEKNNCDILYLPNKEELFPDEELLDMEFEEFDQSMEGHFRPGHLKGMATVVKRFLEIVEPDKAYFGEKDYQQLVVVKKLVKAYNLNPDIIGCATVRESNGLAMSSRNLLLSSDERKEAAVIYDVLSYARRNTDRLSPTELKLKCIQKLENNLLKVEYFEFADSKSLKTISQWDESANPRAFVAAYMGKVRLIDNMSLNV